MILRRMGRNQVLPYGCWKGWKFWYRAWNDTYLVLFPRLVPCRHEYCKEHGTA